MLQNVVIEAINLWKPGFVNNQTKIKWNIDLKAPQTITGAKYQKMAQDIHRVFVIHTRYEKVKRTSIYKVSKLSYPLSELVPSAEMIDSEIYFYFKYFKRLFLKHFIEKN